MQISGKFLIRNYRTIEQKKDGTPIDNPFSVYQLSEVGGTGGDMTLSVNGLIQSVEAGDVVNVNAIVKPTQRGFNQSLWFVSGQVQKV